VFDKNNEKGIQGQFIGKFHNDIVEGSVNGIYENKFKTLFKVMNSEDEFGNNLSGFFSRGRIQGKCQVVF
jgi:hypothetical protein